MKNNYRGLVATCLAAGALVLGGCSRSEYHEVDTSGGIYKLSCSSGRGKSRLEAKDYGDCRRIILETKDAPLYSDRGVTFVSYKLLDRDSPSDKFVTTRNISKYSKPGNEEDKGMKEWVFKEKTSGGYVADLLLGRAMSDIRKHVANCSGEAPCRVSKKK